MAARNQPAAKRLLKELKTYQNDPNEALLHLGPTSDDDLYHWTAIMKGVAGTAYEGTSTPGARISITY